MRKIILTSLAAIAACTTPLAGRWTAAAEPFPVDQGFKGKINFSVKDSVPAWPVPVKAPQGAPNIVLILLDDVGYSVTDVFGGPVYTPALAKLAAQGLRYNNFNTVGACSPTRAALLTGRNHHRVGFGEVAIGGYPGYNGQWPRSAGSIAEVLRLNGYSTAAFGKWHNAPEWESGPLGPFDRWPTRLGFDSFYGFMGGETSQWEPSLYRDTTAVEPPRSAEQGYHLTTDLVDESIRWVRTHGSLSSDKPYFLYFATGATHEPHHVPKEWIDRYRGRFDQGWDQLREENFARQKQLGVIPPGTKLTPRPKDLPAWNSLDAQTRKLLSRQMEIFAGYMAHTDYEIGRLIDAVQKGPGGDNTLIIYIAGDNGASGDGGLTGREGMMDPQPSVHERLRTLDQLGGPGVSNHYSYAWGWANGTPFQYVKKVSSHFGATRDPMVVAWPNGIQQKGGLRTQFAHVTDVAATIYEAARIHPPSMIDGTQQLSIDGTSFLYTFENPEEPSRHRVQYFEMSGNRAMYKDGWIAAARHWAPWEAFAILINPDYGFDRWELYHVDEDYSEAQDLAARYAERLKVLQNLFKEEARQNQVYPLGGGVISELLPPYAIQDRREFVFYADMPRIPPSSAPDFTQSHRIVAQVTIPDLDTQGVIISSGSRVGGFVLFVKDGRVIYDNNYDGRTHSVIRSDVPIPTGSVDIVYEFERRPSKSGADRGGTGRLYINGRFSGTVELPDLNAVSPYFFGGFGIGRNFGSPVSDAYEAPFAFEGTISSVRVKLLP